jgi:hypothetical protein
MSHVPWGGWWPIPRGILCVLSKQYFARQVASLMEFARSTNDKRLSAVLVEKAADLKEQIDEVPLDMSPASLDVLRED